jgi:hypothetical protein
MRYHRAVRRTSCLACAAVVACLLTTEAAHADQPFLQLETATVEHDDERNVEMGASWGRTRHAQTRQFVLEYNFSPLSSVELELGSTRARHENEREREIELGYRYVLVDHNRDDWGLALKASAEWEKESGEDGKGPWRYAGPTVLAAWVLPLADNRVRLHANAGLRYKRDDRVSQRLWGLGAEAHLTPGVVAFAEWGVRRAQDRLQHAGLRWWVKRDKVAVQLSGSRTRDAASGETAQGVHVGVTLSDVSF